MSLRPIFWAMILAVLPNAATAQDAPLPQSSATPITPAIPSDFQLPPGEGESQQQPQARPSAAANPIVQELPAQPTPTPTAAPEAGSPARQEPVQQSADEPVTASEPVQVTPPESEGSAPSPALPPETPAPTADAAANPATAEASEASGNSLWFALIGLMAVLALVAFAFMRRRRTDKQVPVREAEAPLTETPEPASASRKDEPAPPVRREYDPATLVSIKPRSSQPPQRAPAPTTKPTSDGLVSTNLAAKLREQRAALERAEKAQKERAKPARHTVNRSISFDW